MISGVVLAAGESKRFGRTKQLALLEGKSLVQHAIDALVDAGMGEVVIVTGHDADAVEASLAMPPRGRVVRNSAYRDGQASSLSTALHALDDSSEAAVVLMADQPGIGADTVRAIVEEFLATRKQVVRVAYRNGPGPALLSREIYGQAAHLFGDVGARELIASHPEWVEEVPIDEDAPRDVDNPQDLFP